MKRPSFLLAALVCGASLSQAADLYDITLTNAQKYTQCRISYETGSKTKFTGKNRAGQQVTMEVNTSSILVKQEVDEEKIVVEPAPKPEPAPAEAPETTTEESTTAEATTPETPAPAPEAADKPADAPTVATITPPADTDTAKAKDATLRVREKLAQVDAEMNTLSKPSKSLINSVTRTKKDLERKMTELDKIAIEVADLQSKFNQVAGGDYVFTHVSNNDRDKYMRDGQAAHKAMLIDVKEYKNARKVGGLDKFEILRDRYQGIPEYKDAYKWYMSTLKDLQKRWGNLLAREEKKRSKLNSAKKSDMLEKDKEAYNKLEALFEKNGEQIAKVWYNPDNRNLVMLKAATAKVKDALRRNEKGLNNEAIGTVPQLINSFWEAMDRARSLMIAGDMEGAEQTLKNDTTYQKLLRLNRELLPEEYKTPLREQRQDLDREIKRRARERVSLERKLENSIARLERSTGSAEAQLDSLLEQIAREKEVDTNSNKVEIDEQKPAAAQPKPEAPQPKPAATEQPAAPKK
ncbi:MAG: hypothetical protein II295_03860 [Akkermansia sp.]|nr:hypothetical protein [Akkermansia sp.]